MKKILSLIFGLLYEKEEEDIFVSKTLKEEKKLNLDGYENPPKTIRDGREHRPVRKK